MNTSNIIALNCKKNNIYSNDHIRELFLKSGGGFFTSVVDAETVNSICPGGDGRSLKIPDRQS